MVERLRLRPESYFYLAVAIMASAPAWIVRYPPMQDLPQHVAAVRVVHDLHTAAFHLDADYRLNLGGTQYLLYYVLGSALSYVLGVAKANVALCIFYLSATPLAMGALLRSLGRDERISLLTIPILANTWFAFGFMPFLIGIPFMLYATALAVRYLEAPSLRVGIPMALAVIATFYSHLFPFLVFGMAYAALFPWERPSRWVDACLPVAPALALLLWWVALSPAGKESSGVLRDAWRHAPIEESLRQLFTWTAGMFSDGSNEWIFVFFLALCALASGLAHGDPPGASPVTRRLVFVPVACLLLYFFGGENLGHIWPFAQRFPVLGVFMALALVGFPRGLRGHIVSLGALALGTYATVNTCRHFVEFQVEEVGDFEEALASMEPGKRVASLIYDKGSRIMRWVPFLHFGNYYQASKGGVVQYSSATLPHWPFRYVEGRFPPPGIPRPRWEWTPEQVPVRGELYPYYDYVLTRGYGFQPPPGTFALHWQGDQWAVWKKSDPAAARDAE